MRPPATPLSRVRKPLRPEALRPRLSAGMPNQYSQLNRSQFFFQLSLTEDRRSASRQNTRRRQNDFKRVLRRPVVESATPNMTVKQQIPTDRGKHGKTTRRGRLLADMEPIVPWSFWHCSAADSFGVSVVDATVVQTLRFMPCRMRHVT